MKTLLVASFISISSYAQFYNNAEGSPLLDLLKSAQESIKIEIYEMTNQKVLEALRQALERDVFVSIIQEPSPLEMPCQIFTRATSHDSATCKAQKELVAEVKAHEGQYVAFNKAELCGVPGRSCFQHGKIALIDGNVALISTGNFNDTNLCDLDQGPDVCNRDYSFVTEDTEIIAGLDKIFEKDILGKHYDPGALISKSLSSKLTVSPVSLNNIISFIGSATRSIQIQNQYLEEPDLNAALIKAAQKGVKVELMVSDVCNFGKPSATKNSQITHIFTDFDQAGISSRLFSKNQKINGKSGYLHAKAIVVDNANAWIGSMNGSTESALQNREYGVYFDQTESVSKLSKIMANDYQDPNTLTWKQSLSCHNSKQ